MFGTTVVTAITAQNTIGVAQWTGIDPALVRAQLDAVATDLRPAALKSGMLGDEGIVAVVAAGIRHHALTPYVLDPVMVATSGDPLLTPGAVRAIVRELFPLATLVTPNLDEAELLLRETIRTEDAMVEAARACVRELGALSALIKGGHGTGADAVDVVFDGRNVHRFSHPRIATTSSHGSGCTLSAAIAAHLALGAGLSAAVSASLDYVHRAITSAPGFGTGHGPLNHFA